MSLADCGTCGVPRLVSFMHKWRDDGILESKLGRARGVFIEREVFAGTLDRIQDELGISLDSIMIEAKSHDAKLYVDDVLSGVLGKLTRFKPFRKYGYVFMTLQAAYIGLANAQVLSYKLGRHLAGRAENVYHPVLFAGDVAGAFESIERSRCRPSLGKIDGFFYLHADAIEAPRRPGRLAPERVPEIAAKAGYRRCPSCSVPVEVGDFRWKPKEGKIIDSRTGEWVIYIDVEGLNAILRELEKELGEDIPRLVYRFTRDYYSRLIAGERPSFMTDLSFMKFRGFGVPENVLPGTLELETGVNVLNGFNGPMIAGMVSAVCGADSEDLAWETGKPGVVTVRASG